MYDILYKIAGMFEIAAALSLFSAVLIGMIGVLLHIWGIDITIVKQTMATVGMLSFILVFISGGIKLFADGWCDKR